MTEVTEVTEVIEYATLTLTIDTGNQAVVDDPYRACADLLRTAATMIEDTHTYGLLRDANGNQVGTWGLKLDRTEEYRP